MNYNETAKSILELVGGESNLSFVSFCMTRLRLTVKDRGLIEDDQIKNIEGIIGTRMVGAQYQIVIGPTVEKLYNEFIKYTDVDRIDETLVGTNNNLPKEKLTVKSALNNIMDIIAACINPILPVITVAGLLKMIVAVLGPAMLNVLPETHDLFILLNLVGDIGFYSLPIFVAYSSATKFKANIPISLLIASVLLSQNFVNIIDTGVPFTVYGIPMILTNYGSSFLPMILITWTMSKLEIILNKIIPNSLRAMLYPLSLVLIMLPISLTILGPLGTVLGQGIANVLVIMNNVFGPIATGIIAGLWPLLIATGMHHALIAIAVTQIAQVGFDDSILVGAILSNYALIGIGLSFIIKAKKANERSYGVTSLITVALGGISEPLIFGILLKFKKAIVYLLAAGLVGGIYAGIMNVAVYFVPSGNILVALGFAGENPNSLTQGIIAAVISFTVSFVLGIMFGFGNANVENELNNVEENVSNEKNIIPER